MTKWLAEKHLCPEPQFPVRVTLGEVTTLLGSDKPEMMTAWMLNDEFEPEPPDRTGVPGGDVVTLVDWDGGNPTSILVGTSVTFKYSPYTLLIRGDPSGG
ncbi:MAG: hypothetical protein JOZ08_09060 [Verrucomicrobia bacterium]|nr:hypothetical protein [Verrucomicrobiota bacterium]